MARAARLSNSVRQVIRRIIVEYAPERIILYGSRARGDYHRHSDIDILIIKDTPEPFLRRLDAVLDLCDGTEAIEPRVYTPAEIARMQSEGNDFIRSVLAEGVVIYERQQSRPG